MLHTIENNALTVTVAEHGAELQSILCADGTECLWQGNRKYWKDRALNIFPYVARLTEGSYLLDGTLYHMNIHGFAPYSDFTLVKHCKNQLVLELTANDKTLSIYPRKFIFRVVYGLDGHTLHISYEVVNLDTKIMYFGLGGHPGFNVPLSSGQQFEDYRLRFSRPCNPIRMGFTPDCFLSGEDTPYPLDSGQVITLRHDLFDADAVVLKNMDRQITLESPGSVHSITVSFPQMPFLGIWHCPKTDAPFVCIEPWCSLPATHGKITVFEKQADLITLSPGEIYRNHWSIEVGDSLPEYLI